MTTLVAIAEGEQSPEPSSREPLLVTSTEEATKDDNRKRIKRANTEKVGDNPEVTLTRRLQEYI